MKRCFLTRHAWPDNPGNIAYGDQISIDFGHPDLDSKLDAVFDLLPPAAPVSFFASPATRCIETLEYGLDLRGLPKNYVTAPGLLEQRWGTWTNVPRYRISRSELATYLRDPDNNAPPQGESMHTQRKRVLPAFQHAVVEDGTADIHMGVIHGGSMRAVLSHIMGQPMSAILANKTLKIDPLDVLELEIPASVKDERFYHEIKWTLHKP